MLSDWKNRARALKRDAVALTFAWRDRRTPWYAKVLLGLVVAHTFSPIDLIPDFIPVLGYLDDLMITPLGLALAFKMVPPEVMAEARQRAENELVSFRSWAGVGAALVILIWLVILLTVGLALARASGAKAGG